MRRLKLIKGCKCRIEEEEEEEVAFNQHINLDLDLRKMGVVFHLYENKMKVARQLLVYTSLPMVTISSKLVQ
jgi:hypothetical protein